MRLAIIAALGILLAGCAGGMVKQAPANTGEAAEAAPATQRVSIDGGDVYEDCFELEAGQSMHYEFNSDGELGYNLHWHTDAHNVKYEARETGVKTGKGTFTAGQKEYYCLMWQNKGQLPVSLRFSTMIKQASGVPAR